MKRGIFQKGCRNIACRVAENRMLSRGWEGKVPEEVIGVFEDILAELFESYILQECICRLLLKKHGKIRELAAGLEINFNMLPAEIRITRAIERSEAEQIGINTCLRSIMGSDTTYFIQQVKMSKHQMKKMEKRSRKEVRMMLGNKLDDLLPV